MENPKQTANSSIHSLEEFIRAQGLVDWPVSCDEDPQEVSSVWCGSAEIHEALRSRECFPIGGAQSLQTDLQALWKRVRLHRDTLSPQRTAEMEITSTNTH